ncbi:uncharacterized protein LOC144124769 isoform X2 [Amblyomma americanum]
MKVFLVLVICTMATSAYAALIRPTGEHEKRPIKDEAKLLQLKKAGKTMESFGLILQGQVSAVSKEDIEEVLRAFEDVKHSDFDEEAEEYFFMDLLKSVFVSALKTVATETVKKIVKND